MKIKIEKKIFFIIIGIIMTTCFLTPQKVSASEKQGSLIIYDHGITPEGIRVELSNVDFYLYKAGEKTEEGWKLQGDFEKASVNTDDMSSSGQRHAAEQLYDFVTKEKPKGKTATTDGNGKVDFYGLEEGMYLCVPAPEVPWAEGAFHSAPFLVFIPMVDENGNSIYHVTAEPKNQWDENQQKPQNPGSSEEKPEDKGSGNAKTGENTKLWPYVMLLFASVISMVMGRRKKREETIEDTKS